MQKYCKSIHTYVNRIVRNREDADEITNDTFLKVFNERNKIQSPEKLLGWLYTTAKNASFDCLRSRQRENNQKQEYLRTFSYDGQDVAEVLMLAARQNQQDKKYKDLLNGLVRLLSEKDRVVVEYLLDGLKPKQIAEAIGSTAEAVQKIRERIVKWLHPIALHSDELIDNLSPDDKKIMERYLDNQPIEDISDKLGISMSDIEACVKRVVKKWKKVQSSNS